MAGEMIWIFSHQGRCSSIGICAWSVLLATSAAFWLFLIALHLTISIILARVTQFATSGVMGNHSTGGQTTLTFRVLHVSHFPICVMIPVRTRREPRVGQISGGERITREGGGAFSNDNEVADCCLKRYARARVQWCNIVIHPKLVYLKNASRRFCLNLVKHRIRARQAACMSSPSPCPSQMLI